MLLLKDTIWKGEILYRRIRHSRGHGVHSPFVFNLITKVIEERRAFYCYQDIELIRKRLLQNNSPIIVPGFSYKNEPHQTTIARIVRQKAISPKKGAFLFRLANYFKVKNILQIGSSMGISTLYLTSYAPGLNCTSFEVIPEYTSVSQWVYKEAARTEISLNTGDPHKLLPAFLKEGISPDLIFFSGSHEQIDTLSLFSSCLAYAGEQAIFVIDNIKKNKHMRTVWQTIITHPDVTVSVDMYSMGLVFLNKKLHKQNYKVYF